MDDVAHDGDRIGCDIGGDGYGLDLRKRRPSHFGTVSMTMTTKFLVAVGLIAALVLDPAGAAEPGPAAPTNDGRVTINAPSGYLNLVKGSFAFVPDPSNMDANGYPVRTPAVGIGANPDMPVGYFGEYVWKWSGTGTMRIGASPPMMISANTSAGGGQAIFGFGGIGEFAGGDTYIGGMRNLGVDSPRLQFLFGVSIQSITNNGTGLIRIGTRPGFTANMTTGMTVNISGASDNTNVNGTWTITVGAGFFDLQGSTFANSAAAGGKAVIQATNLSILIMPTGKFSGFSDLVWCKAADEAAIASGQIWDTTLVSQLKSLLNPHNEAVANAWLRFMDYSGAQQAQEYDFSQRIPLSYLTYGSAQYFRPGYWVGPVTADGNDHYTSSAPASSVWNGSAYIDGAIVQGNVNAANVGSNPDLAVGGHPAKPVYSFFNGQPAYRYEASAPAAAAGLPMVFTFSAPWINGGAPYSVTYQTTTRGPHGSDTASASALSLNIASAFQADPVLVAAGLQYGNPSIGIYPRTAQAGRLSMVYSSGPAVIHLYALDPGTINAGRGSFVYNYLLDGWIYRPGGVVMAAPIEGAAQLCNLVGAHCWWNWGSVTGAVASHVTANFAANLNPGLKFGMETGNEVWNFAAYPAATWSTQGSLLGFPIGSSAAVYSFTALRTIQYAALSKAAWTAAGRAALDHYVMQPSATYDVATNGNFDRAQLKGVYLNRTGGKVDGIAANPIYAAHGGLAGSGAVSADYNISPNRPVDITRAIGSAPYWSSHWWGNGGSIADAGSVVGTAAENAPWLQAAKDYAAGNISAAFASLVSQFNGTTRRRSGNSGGLNFLDAKNKIWIPGEICAAQYDAGRPALGLPPLAMLDYEDGPSWGIGANGINGVNSVNSGDVAALANRMTALGWNVGAYTRSGADDKTEMATMTLAMAQAWKFDASYKDMIKTYAYQARKDASPGREVHSAQFGYSGPSQWSLFPGNYGSNTPYSSYDAIREFNQ